MAGDIIGSSGGGGPSPVFFNRDAAVLGMSWTRTQTWSALPSPTSLPALSPRRLVNCHQTRLSEKLNL
ncbi:hypothetical protein B296_00012559 [Ensete ventricosum]|uniref:Uncharacterized protein n=1 Tax=Ensete ventricosum TaxID=4639 RepID=A0A427AYJ1_ENSVE|nr:hypothetical protein B296_00012559 [Ensete ventricosum]